MINHEHQAIINMYLAHSFLICCRWGLYEKTTVDVERQWSENASGRMVTAGLPGHVLGTRVATASSTG